MNIVRTRCSFKGAEESKVVRTLLIPHVGLQSLSLNRMYTLFRVDEYGFMRMISKDYSLEVVPGRHPWIPA